MLDPLLLRIIALGFALLFIPAALHKFSQRLQFSAQLQAYQMLPVALLSMAARALPLFELLLGISWLMSVLLVPIASATAVASALLLGLYTIGIGVNLLRGRHYIDCGCGLATSVGERAQNDTQNLSYWLVLRNFLLIIAALAAALPATARTLGGLDYFSLLTAVLTLVFLYAAYNQLMSNNNAIRSGSNARG